MICLESYIQPKSILLFYLFKNTSKKILMKRNRKKSEKIKLFKMHLPFRIQKLSFYTDATEQATLCKGPVCTSHMPFTLRENYTKLSSGGREGLVALTLPKGLKAPV